MTSLNPITNVEPRTGADLIGPMYAHRQDAARRIDADHRELRQQKLEQVERDFGALLLRTLAEGTSLSEITRLTGASRNTLKSLRDRAMVGGAR